MGSEQSVVFTPTVMTDLVNASGSSPSTLVQDSLHAYPLFEAKKTGAGFRGIENGGDDATASSGSRWKFGGVRLLLELFKINKHLIMGRQDDYPSMNKNDFFEKISEAMAHNPSHKKTASQIRSKMRQMAHDLHKNNITKQVLQIIDEIGVRNELCKLFSLSPSRALPAPFSNNAHSSKLNLFAEALERNDVDENDFDVDIVPPSDRYSHTNSPSNAKKVAPPIIQSNHISVPALLSSLSTAGQSRLGLAAPQSVDLTLADSNSYSSVSSKPTVTPQTSLQQNANKFLFSSVDRAVQPSYVVVSWSQSEIITMLNIFAANKHLVFGDASHMPWTRTSFYKQIAVTLHAYNPEFKKSHHQIGPKLRSLTYDMHTYVLSLPFVKVINELNIRIDLFRLFGMQDPSSTSESTATTPCETTFGTVASDVPLQSLTDSIEKKRRSIDDVADSFTRVELARQENKKRKLEFLAEKLEKEFECRRQDSERQFRQRERQLEMQHALELKRVTSSQTTMLEMQQTIRMQQKAIQDLIILSSKRLENP